MKSGLYARGRRSRGRILGGMMVRVLGAEDYRPLVVSAIPDSMNWAWVRRSIREIINSIRRRELRV
jgi:hypothetical protein